MPSLTRRGVHLPFPLFGLRANWQRPNQEESPRAFGRAYPACLWVMCNLHLCGQPPCGLRCLACHVACESSKACFAVPLWWLFSGKTRLQRIIVLGRQSGYFFTRRILLCFEANQFGPIPFHLNRAVMMKDHPMRKRNEVDWPGQLVGP